MAALKDWCGSSGEIIEFDLFGKMVEGHRSHYAVVRAPALAHISAHKLARSHLGQWALDIEFWSPGSSFICDLLDDDIKDVLDAICDSDFGVGYRRLTHLCVSVVTSEMMKIGIKIWIKQ